MIRKYSHIVSTTPRRTRIRLSSKRCNTEEMQKIAEALKSRPSVEGVRFNPGTGSLLVHHSHGSLDRILNVLRDLGVVFASSEGLDLPGSEVGPSGLAGAIADLNKRLGLSESGIFSLRNTVPFGFGLLAVFQLSRRGLQLGAAPWYFLAFLAFESYMRLHPPNETPVPKSPQEKNSSQ